MTMIQKCPICQEKKYQPVSLFILLVCFIYESFLVFSIMLLGTAIWMLLSFSIQNMGYMGDPVLVLLNQTLKIWILFILGFYFVMNWHIHGQTLAMKTWRVLLVDKNHQKISFSRLIGRYMLLMTLISFIWFFFDKNGLFLHDRLMGTKLVRDQWDC